MYRDCLSELTAWKNSPTRKPLIVRGARQVGKTWLLRELGRTQYQKCVYVNFENAAPLRELFLPDFDISRIITALQIYSRTQITPGNTLIIFDEIQSVERGLTALKYFCEEAPEYHVAAAGSLLGMGLHGGVSFPVGKVNFIDVRPLSFYEFLQAVDETLLVEQLRAREWKTVAVFHQRLTELVKTYFVVGGMPEVVVTYLNTNNFDEVRRVQHEILTTYEADFSKHAPAAIVPRLRLVWQSIPAQLAKENKKFVYGALRQGARAKDFELAIEWICNCGLFLKQQRVAKPALPLMAYQDMPTFKLFLHDVGLLAALSLLDPRVLLEKNKVFTEFKGAFTEQYVMQQLQLRSADYIGYWTNERSTAEVDFVLQRHSDIYAIEAKAETNVHAKSFKLFCQKYPEAKAIRFSMLPYREEEWLTNIPLYAVESL